MRKQRGISILILTITLLFISTLFILFSARFSGLQQKITGDFYANQQAFEAAQAGIEAAIPYLENNYSAIINNQKDGYLEAYVNTNTQNVALADGSQYGFVFLNATANDFRLITITSTGVNSDGTSTRVISQQVYAYSTGAVPSNTLSAQENITLKNASSLSNTETNSNIVAGKNVHIEDSAKTTTRTGVASSASLLGSDVSQNNVISGWSSSKFFNSVFGISEYSLLQKANYSYVNATNTSYNFLNGITGAIIWINQISDTATINSSTVIGSAAQPVILVVQGNLIISDSATIYGLVFNLDPSNTAILSNTATIYGAFASTSDLQLINSAMINYNASVLYALPATGATPNYAKLPGSWKDF